MDRGSFALNCPPAINLFPRRADRIHVSDQQAEHHVVVLIRQNSVRVCIGFVDNISLTA